MISLNAAALGVGSDASMRPEQAAQREGKGEAVGERLRRRMRRLLPGIVMKEDTIGMGVAFSAEDVDIEDLNEEGAQTVS